MNGGDIFAAPDLGDEASGGGSADGEESMPKLGNVLDRVVQFTAMELCKNERKGSKAQAWDSQQVCPLFILLKKSWKCYFDLKCNPNVHFLN